MNNKGFTLIELTAIILVLATIFLISFPKFMNMAISDEEKKYENMIDNLCLAGESYIYNNIDEFKQYFTVDNKIEIIIEELIVYGNVDNNLNNPKTEKSVKNDILTYTVMSDNSLSCEYIENYNNQT